jgi:type IV pilus assembly protein PilQ
MLKTTRALIPIAVAVAGGCGARAPVVSGSDDWIEPAALAPAMGVRAPAASLALARPLAAAAGRSTRIAPPAPRCAPRYAGRPIDIDLKDADLHNVFRFLAEYGGVNIVVADGVTGSVTLRLKRVPWDEVLCVIARVKGLSIAREGGILFVTPAS